VQLYLQLLLLLIVANGAPVAARVLLGKSLERPVDFGAAFLDGKRLFGPRKTLRGLLAAIVATPLVASLLGLPVRVGLLVAIGAMAGDLLSSFVKRRLGVAPHSNAPGLDQLPECLLPLLLVRTRLQLDFAAMAGLILGFLVAELVLTAILARVERRWF